MNKVIFLFFALATSTLLFAQKTGENDREKAVQEIKALFKELNDAIVNHDRKKLESLYADEFLFIHGLGFVEGKTEQINGIMETDSVSALPVPAFDQFYVYGDAAVLRSLTRNPIAGNSLMSTTVYAKRAGRWQIVQVQSTQQQKERKSVTVDAKFLDSYVGRYVQPNGSLIEVAREGNTLTIQRKGRPTLTLVPTSNTQFFDKFGTSYTFEKNGNNVTSSFTMRAQNGQETLWTKSQ